MEQTIYTSSTMAAAAAAGILVILRVCRISLNFPAAIAALVLLLSSEWKRRLVFAQCIPSLLRGIGGEFLLHCS